jgi:DNA primase
MSLAAAWFERMLREHPLSGHAHAELERRALVAQTPTDPIADALQAFRIGYAPFGWEGLSHYLREHKASLVAAEKVGLVSQRKSGAGYYDRFRHRLMFAVLDVQGRVIAFSGRALAEPSAAELAPLGLTPSPADAEAPAKYYNSPESPIYRKREALFGLYQARSAIRSQETCLIVEGNFDVLSLHARGIHNVVAPLGTAFTVEQAQQLRRFCQEVVLLFDGDAAGRRAVQATREICQKVELSAKVATLSEKVDPDDLVRREGREGIERVVARARGLLNYLIDTVLDGNFAQNDAHGRAAKVKEVLDLLASERDPTARAQAEQHANMLAQRLNVADAPTFRALASEVRRALAQGESPVKMAAPAVATPMRARSPARKDAVALEILGALLDFPELFEAAETREAASLFEGDAAVSYAALRQAWERGELGNAEVVLAKLAPSIHPFARARLVAPRHAKAADAQIELAGNVRQLKALVLSRDKKTVVEELERARRTGDFDRERALLGELYQKARQHRVVASE